MYVIPREEGESIVIGENIVVTILEIRDECVQLSIERPPGVSVGRTEVLEALVNHAPDSS